MRNQLDKQLAEFLKRRRGPLTYAAFAKKLGISTSTLHRLESGDQSITLRMLGQIMQKLRCTLWDIFGK